MKLLNLVISSLLVCNIIIGQGIYPNQLAPAPDSNMILKSKGNLLNAFDYEYINAGSGVNPRDSTVLESGHGIYTYEVSPNNWKIEADTNQVVTPYDLSQVDQSATNELQTLSADSTSTTIGIKASGNNSRVHFSVLKSEVDGSVTNEKIDSFYLKTTGQLRLREGGTVWTINSMLYGGSSLGANYLPIWSGGQSLTNYWGYGTVKIMNGLISTYWWKNIDTLNVSDGIVVATSKKLSAITNNSNNWNTAYSWGNHSGLYVPLVRTITINGTSQDLSANRTWNVGTVTSVGLLSGSSGTDVNVSGSPVTGSGNIVFNIPQASATKTGKISSTDWTNFDNMNKIYSSNANWNTAYNDNTLKGYFGNTNTPDGYFMSGLWAGYYSSNSSAYGSQIGVSYGNMLYFRFRNNGTWLDWKRAVTIANPTQYYFPKCDSNGDLEKSSTYEDGLYLNTTKYFVINHAIAPIQYYQIAGSSKAIMGSELAIFGTNPDNFSIYVYGNNEFNVATNGTKRLKISGAGAVTITNLAGTYNRLVYTDANGILNPVTTGTGYLKSNGTGAFTYDNSTFQTTSLTDGKIRIGNGFNTAQEQTMSGDATMTNTGVVTVGDDTHTHTASTIIPNIVSSVEGVANDGSNIDLVGDGISITGDDANNNITISQNQKFLKASASDTTKCGYYAWRKIKFNNEIYDTGPYTVDPGNNTIQVPSIGYYEIETRIKFGNNNSQNETIITRILVNGSEIAYDGKNYYYITPNDDLEPIIFKTIVLIPNTSHLITVEVKNANNNDQYVSTAGENNPIIMIKKIANY